MDEKIADWLKDNVEQFRNPDGRVRIGGLESAIEASLGTSVGTPELYAWLEKNGYVNPVDKLTRKPGPKREVKMGWPKGKSRKGQKRKSKNGKALVPKYIDSFEARLFDGRVFIPLEEAQRIFGK